jgi:hypothetical protein
MPARHDSGNLSGSAQSLLALLFGAGEPVGGENDVPCNLLMLQADDGNSNEIRVGVGTGLSATDWGLWINAPATSVPDRPLVIGPFDRGGPIKLSEVFVLGTANEDLHVFYVWW